MMIIVNNDDVQSYGMVHYVGLKALLIVLYINDVQNMLKVLIIKVGHTKIVQKMEHGFIIMKQNDFGLIIRNVS